MAKKRAFKVEDVFRHWTLTDLSATPDGSAVAFAAAGADLKKNKAVKAVWLWRRGDGSRQVTFAGEAGQPRFSPNGKRLAFLSDRGGDKQQLHVMDGGFSEGRKVTEFEHGVVKFTWSPNGRQLAVVAQPDKTPEEKKKDEEKRDWWTFDEDERRRALWVVSADGRGKPRRVSGDGEHVSSVDWLPDGDSLAYVACPVATIDSQWFESDLRLVSAKGAGHRTICPVRGHLVESPIHVSPQGDAVLLTEACDDKDLFHDVAKVADLKTGEKQSVHPETDIRSVAPQWLPDGRVFFETGIGTTYELCVCAVGGKPETLETGPAVSANAAIAGEASTVFYVASATQEPDEVCAVPLGGSAMPKRLTNVNRGMASCRLAKSEVVRWKSDGMDVEGILYLPSKSGARKPYPLILMPHGGPYGASITSYNGAVAPNIFCAAGYACLLPNFRGSTGYGRLFTRKIVRDWGDGPFTDIMAGIDSLVRRRIIDGKRMAVFGGSYGGYMTAWTVGHTTRFRCAVAVAAVIDNLSMWGTTDIPRFQHYSSGNALADFTDKYWRDQSPLYYVDKVKTPTLVITGEVDKRVPPGQSHEFYRALKARGVDTKLVLYPREPHGVSEPRHRVHYFTEILEYINGHLRK